MSFRPFHEVEPFDCRVAFCRLPECEVRRIKRPLVTLIRSGGVGGLVVGRAPPAAAAAGNRSNVGQVRERERATAAAVAADVAIPT